MQNKLRQLFDFQRFEGEPRLAAMLAETEARYASLSDDALELVSAAGTPDPLKDLERKEW